jgi:hypothetical protein
MGKNSRHKLWTHLERTYKQCDEPIIQSCVETTIRGWPVTLLKYKGRTDFTFMPTGRAGEISEAQFLAAFGSEDPEFVWELLHQLANVGPHSESPDVEGLKFALAAVSGMAPRDPLDALTCAQMAAVHSISMMYADRLADAAPYTLDMAREEPSLTRLLRTYSALTTALDHHRNAGDRKIAAHQVLAYDTRSNGSALQKPENQTYLHFERTGEHGESAHGSQDPDFVFGLFGPLTKIGAQGRFRVDEGLRFARATVRGMAPRDPVESKLCAQMAVVHSVSMMFAHRLAHEPEHLAELDSAERSLNSFSRTFCALMKAFDHHGDVRDRKIARQQVSLAKGSHAIVGDVHQNDVKAPGKVNGHASA